MKNSKAGSGGIKSFFLYNIEKLILVISLILLALFFYLGLNSETFDKSPDNLVSEAKQATSYIEKASSWEEIAAFRKGDVEVVDRVKAAGKPVDSSNFKVAGLSMVPKALQLRLDPPLPSVQDVEAHVLRASVIVQNKQTGFNDPILNLPLAFSKSDPNSKASLMKSMESEMRASGPMGMGGRGGRSDRDDDEEMKMMGMGGPSSRGNKKKGKKIKDPQIDAEVDAWWGFPGVQEAMEGGVRPRTVASAGNDMALTRNVVVVNALVDHKSLWKLHEKTLSSSLGYYPKRDLPRYDYLQVERRAVVDGKPGQWTDISTFVNFDQANLYPSSFTSAPEVVPPGNYDQYLTNAIPPIVGTDYTSKVIHSKLEKRTFKVPEEEDQGMASSDLLAGKKDLKQPDEMMKDRMGRGIRKTKKGLSGAGGMGGMGGMSGMGRAMSGMGDMSMGGLRRAGDGRSSSDLTEYEELADPTLEPVSDFKQVRFFDMSVSPKNSAVYEYRMRVWVADPNNADDKAVTGMNDMRGDSDAMRAMGGMGVGNKDQVKVYTKTKINFTMQDQSVRNRIKRGREAGAITEKEYFVSEVYEGSDEPVEVKVPVGEEYLRFARPTQWSKPVTVSIASASAGFFAQAVAEPRTARVGNTEIPIDETKAEIVLSVEDSKFQGTKLAAMRLSSVGDLLNFTESVTVMHPVAQSIHFLHEANIESNGVLIDVMGGERLDVARGEPLQYDLPGETLIMDGGGNFIISNDIEDLQQARHALRLPDERCDFGGKKAARRAVQEKADMMKRGGDEGGFGRRR